MAIVYHDMLLEHVQWEGHPESPFRIKTLKRKLENEGLWKDVVAPDPIDENLVLRVHTQKHLDRLNKGDNLLVDHDTMLGAKTYRYAMLSASVAVTAVKLAMNGTPALGLTRPPGHHAGKETMGGFCYLNNVAVAVETAGVRTAIIDIDAHHCNGTEEIFYGRDDVLVTDLHEAGIYPGTGQMECIGTGAGTRYTVNIPIPAGSGNKSYEKAMSEIVVPVLREFKPELTVVSLGVDAHYCDPTSHLLLNTQGYIELCKRLIGESENGKMAFILEGGYHLRATAEVVAGVMATLDGKEIKAEYGEDKGEQSNGLREVRKIKEYIGEKWNL